MEPRAAAPPGLGGLEAKGLALEVWLPPLGTYADEGGAVDDGSAMVDELATVPGSILNFSDFAYTWVVLVVFTKDTT